MNQASFWQLYSDAALTSLSFFWKALWAFILGYIVSSAIQVFVTRERMKRSMGSAGKGSIALATFFGFISSSCSFAALATTKSLFKKGAGFISSQAFLLASTNLVIELGVIIAIFLSWQFVVGEYVGGLLLIGFMWLFVRFTRPTKLIQKTRKRLADEEGEEEDQDVPDWRDKIQSLEGWRQVARHYFMEWGMVWKDVTFGFTVAGVIAAFVPQSFFQTLFIGSGQGQTLGFLAILEHILIGPIAAFFTFIGSMGNIPLASILFANGVSFAGVMAFIFSDLVVFPIIRINAKYYGWKMAFYILGIFMAALVSAAFVLHYGFALFGILPEGGGAGTASTQKFAIDYTFFLNLLFLVITGVLAWLRFSGDPHGSHDQGGKKDLIEQILFVLAILSYIWLAGGVIVALLQ